MDYGKLTDHNSRTVAFRNIILIMTSNVGASNLDKNKIGFTGKFALHPSSIDQINQTFSPSQQLINEAKNVLAAAKNASKNSHGTTSINGKLIDAPVIKRAKNLLQRAEIITQTKKNS